MLKTLGIVLLTIILVIGVINPLIGASGSTRFNYGSTTLTDSIQVVPNSPTSLASTDTYIFQITATNVSSGAATFSITDGSGRYLLHGVSIDPDQTYVIAFPEGQRMISGASWYSDTSNAIQASIRARRN